MTVVESYQASGAHPSTSWQAARRALQARSAFRKPKSAIGSPATSSVPTKMANSRTVSWILVALGGVTIGGMYTFVANWGAARGLNSLDMMGLRMAAAGLMGLPALSLTRRKDVFLLLTRWRAWLPVSVSAGATFGFLIFIALQWSASGHSVAFPFTTLGVSGAAVSAGIHGEWRRWRSFAEVAAVVAGLMVFSGFDLQTLNGHALIGDSLFVAVGALWAGFGMVMRKRQVDALLATAFVSFAASLTYLPIYFRLVGLRRLDAVAPGALVAEFLVQGAMAGVVALYSHSTMATTRDPTEPRVLRALTPGATAVLASPVMGHTPMPIKAIGMLIVLSGLVISGATARIARASPYFDC